ncbi:MAG: hypothetical protein HC844_15525 [Tabrizicola sp.]|nr:hypothetical protein [Tabrizicola sp.]
MFSRLAPRREAGLLVGVSLVEDAMIRFALVCLAPVCLALSAQGARAEEGVALGFDGLYAPEGLPCAGSPRIAVRGGIITGDEWSMTVTDLIEFPGEANKVEATIDVSAGGNTWTESAVITLDGEGQDVALIWDYPDGTRNIWQRCD